MTMTVNQYIDLCLIDEYADKDHINGFALDLDDLPKNEIANFLDVLMEEDTAVRDLVLCHMQQLINERLPERERDTRWLDGFTTSIDLQTGEPIVRPRATL